MKIAFVSAGVLPIPAVNGGAVETLVENIINQNEEQKKLKITIFSPAFDKSFLENYNYKHANIKMIKIPNLANTIYNLYEYILAKIFTKRVRKNLYIIKVVNNLKKMEFDAIIIENRPQYVIPISSHVNTKVILHQHNDTLNLETVNGKDIVDSCYEIFAVSEYIKKRILTIHNSVNDKVKVWFNGIDLNKFNGSVELKSVEKLKSKYIIKEDEFVITFIGRLEDEKGIKELIYAFNQLGHNKLVLLIVGSFWYDKNNDNSFTNEIKELSDSSKHKIIFTGYIEHNNIPLYHALSDILVIPSKCEEGCSLAVFEALSSGVATIVSDAGSNCEIVGENNALVTSRKPDFTKNLYISLKKLIDNDDLRIELGKNGKEHIKKYSLEKFYQDLIELISKNKNE